MATMLQLVQQATGEMGLSVPNSVAGNASQDAIQQLALLNAVGYELQREYDWQKAIVEYRFTTQYLTTTGSWTTSNGIVTGIPTTAALAASTWMAVGAGIPQDTYISTVDGATQVTLTQTPTAAGTAAAISFCQTKYTMPSDYDRPINSTQWDKSKHWEMLGPSSPQQWQWIKSGYISTGPRLRFRPFGGYFQIWPATPSNEYIGMEYVSTNWASAAAGTGKTSFTVDTDTCIFPDRLMVLGLKAKYYQAKGFDANTYIAQFMRELSIAKANDSGASMLSMAPRMSSALLGVQNLPDAGYGS